VGKGEAGKREKHPRSGENFPGMPQGAADNEGDITVTGFRVSDYVMESGLPDSITLISSILLLKLIQLIVKFVLPLSWFVHC